MQRSPWNRSRPEHLRTSNIDSPSPPEPSSCRRRSLMHLSSTWLHAASGETTVSRSFSSFMGLETPAGSGVKRLLRSLAANRKNSAKPSGNAMLFLNAGQSQRLNVEAAKSGLCELRVPSLGESNDFRPNAPKSGRFGRQDFRVIFRIGCIPILGLVVGYPETLSLASQSNDKVYGRV